MKIALDTSVLKTGHKVRGVGRYLNDLVKALNQYDRENIYLTDGRKVDFEQADVIHYPYFHPFVVTLPKVFFKPTVVTIHDLVPLIFPEAYPPGLRGRVNYFIQKKRLGRVAKVVTDSETSTRDVGHFYKLKKDQIRTVYLAPDQKFEVIGRFNSRLRKTERAYRVPKKFVLYVGDVNYNKNLPRLVQACWQAQVPLLIAGKQAAISQFDRSHPENREWAWLREQIEREVKLSNGEVLIRPLGFVPDEELVSLYNLASCYCQPSRYEGFGLPVLEAMSCGVPVVVAANSSLIEIVGSAGILVKGEGIDSLAKALGEVLDNSRLRKQLVARGLAQAAKFNWQKTALAMRGIYEEAVKK